MGKTLESIFVSEFKKEVANIGYKDIYKIPLPRVCDGWEVSKTELYAVKGITAPHYDALNKKIVRKMPSDYIAKRRVIDKSSREFAKDENGKYLYADYTVPSGSTVVLSEENIQLPYKDYAKKATKDGYGYIDFVEYKGIEYIYVLPKSVLYKVNQTALALSVKNMKNYSGSGYMTWKNGMIFLHIIPYKPNAHYEGTKILKTGYTLNYKDEIASIVQYWIKQGVIPNLELCALQNGDNLAIKGTVTGYDSYIPVESLAVSDKEIYGSDGEIVNK